MRLLITLLKGCAIGLANIIPGVSGGTMALVLGIYTRLIEAIQSIGPTTIKSLFAGRKAFLDELKRIDAVFLSVLGCGALIAIVSVAKLMTYLLDQQHDPTYGFFFGLVLVSVIVPYKMIKRLNASAIISAWCAIAVVVGLSLAMSGEEKVASAQKKAAIKSSKAKEVSVLNKAEDKTIRRSVSSTLSPSPSAAKLIWFFIAGAIAISAMVLPGISGSFLLLVMGAYFEILSCIIERQWLLLGVFALGCMVGLVVFTRFLNFILKRFYDVTIAFLLGLVVGSLYAIWPFKSFALVAGKRIDMDNIWPTVFGHNELITLATALLGGLIVVVSIVLEAKSEKKTFAE